VCRYRDAFGQSCAIGCLIDNQHYNTSIENFTIENTQVRTAVEYSLHRKLDKREIEFLSIMQSIHDQYIVDMWEDKWRNTARDYRLKYTESTKHLTQFGAYNEQG